MTSYCRATLTVAFAILGGCGREFLGADEEPVVSDPTLRAPLESVPEVAAGNDRIDENGRLLPAESLVNGFEVPRALRLVEQKRDYLAFEVGATAEELQEFYTGIDAKTGRRFSERRYLIDASAIGFDVQHTRETLERLRLDERYRQGYLFVSPIRARLQSVRVHLSPPPPGPDDDPFVPRIEAAGPGEAKAPQGAPPARGGNDGFAGARGGATDGSAGSAGGGSRGGSTGGSAGGQGDSGSEGAATGGANTGPTGGGGAVPGPVPLSATPGNIPGLTLAPPSTPSKRYGPYPTVGRSTAPAIRKWQAANPSQRFLD